MVINIDFDGTVVTHDYPLVGTDIGAARVLKRLTSKGHKLILFTMRSHKPFLKANGEMDHNGLNDAIGWFKMNDIPLYGIQSNPTQHHWTESPKSYANLMIDDSAIGCPLILDEKIHSRPFVDWNKIEVMLEDLNLI